MRTPKGTGKKGNVGKSRNKYTFFGYGATQVSKPVKVQTGITPKKRTAQHTPPGAIAENANKINELAARLGISHNEAKKRLRLKHPKPKRR